jgi:hypothetical protein
VEDIRLALLQTLNPTPAAAQVDTRAVVGEALITPIANHAVPCLQPEAPAAVAVAVAVAPILLAEQAQEAGLEF